MNLIAAANFSDGIGDAWSQIATFTPKFIAFLIILIIGYFVAKAISKAADKILDRVGFDKAVERGGIAKAMSKSKYDASDIVSKLVFYALVLFVLQFAFGVFGTNPVSDLLASVIAYLPKVFVAVIIIVIAGAAAAAIREVVKATLGGLSYGNAVASGIGAAILGVGVFASLNQLQIAPAIVNGLFYAILAAIVGILVIAVGGGGIKPMAQRWETVLQKYDSEKGNIASQASGSRERIVDRAQQLRDQAK